MKERQTVALILLFLGEIITIVDEEISANVAYGSLRQTRHRNM